VITWGDLFNSFWLAGFLFLISFILFLVIYLVARILLPAPGPRRARAVADARRVADRLASGLHRHGRGISHRSESRACRHGIDSGDPHLRRVDPGLHDREKPAAFCHFRFCGLCIFARTPRRQCPWNGVSRSERRISCERRHAEKARRPGVRGTPLSERPWIAARTGKAEPAGCASCEAIIASPIAPLVGGGVALQAASPPC
jgi:hypothetical protein